MTLKYFNVKNGLTTGNITINASNSNISASTFIGNLSVTSTANLGSVSNVKITGGTANYVLSTDGTGNLTWVSQAVGNAGNVIVDTFTANGTGTTYTLSSTPTSEDYLIVNLDGVLQLHSAYSLSGNVLTMSTAPTNGAALEVQILNMGSGGGGGGSTNPAGANTQVQFNDAGSFGASANLTFNKSTNLLTVSGSLSTTGNANLGNLGTTGVFATTLSATGNANIGNIGTTTAIITTGNITTINSSLFQNGNSNITITANGNISLSATGTPNEIVVTSTGVNVAGTLSVAGNANVGNLGLATGVFTGNLSVTGGINDTGSNYYTIGYREVPQVAKSTNYTLENYDNGKHIYYTGSGNTLTLPADGSTTGGNFPVGTVLTVVNNSSGNVLVNTTVTLNHAGTANTGNRTIATKGLATLIKVAANNWFISGTGIT